MESSALIKEEDDVDGAKICRWCLTADDALEALTPDQSGQYKVQKIFDFTDLQIELSPGVPSYLCTTCESRLEKMDTFRWRCNEKNDMVDKFIERQNTVKNESEITQDHLGHTAEQTVGTEMVIKTEVTEPDEANDLHLNQKRCSVHQVNGTPECYGNQPLEAEANPITIKLEYVDVDEMYGLQTNAILDHEQDDLQTNPLELVCQDREGHSMSNNICGDGTELLIKTVVTSPDSATDLNLKQRSCTVHQVNRTYECCDNQPDDLFEAEENPIAIKSEYEEVDGQHQLQTTNDDLEQNNLKSPHKKQKHHCPHCSATYTALHNLKIHIRTHTGERPYQCKVCHKAFYSSSHLAEHYKIHNKDQQHQCPQCSSTFTQLSNLEYHIRTHTGERPYQCKVCDKSFRSSSKLTQHSKIHNKDQQHQCPYCSLKFPCLPKLKIHIRTHTGEKPFQCKVCDKAFSASRYLASHSKIHNKAQQHQCPQCSSTFAQLSALKIHIRTHTGERPYQCKVCDKAFRSSNLAIHSKIHNKAQQHQCPQCSSTFARLSTLKIHIRTHTGERPYQCKVCDKAFSHSSNLAYHSKIHKNVEHH